MKYTELGHTGINVSRICVGGMSFGRIVEGGHRWLLDQEQTTSMIAEAFDQGVNFIDTANQYAAGSSEEFIGRALKDLGIARDKVVIASKVYFNEGHLSRKAILREIEGTLTRLQTDYLDLYQIHRFDYDTPIEETMEALHDLVIAGKVRAIGASAMYGYQFHNMQLCAHAHGWTSFSAMQNHYNLLYREDERELIPVCEQYEVSRIPYSPLAGGHLTHTGWRSGSRRSDTDKILAHKYDMYEQEDLAIIDRVSEVAEKHGVSMTQVALAWQYCKGVAAPIVGATKAAHFKDACKAVDLVLNDEDVKYLEELYTVRQLVGLIQHG
ncbi:MAG: aldo/keto reductase [Solobacterium sp.]|nr:aldo/keto reductase [Solobacterium sp.]